MKIISRVRCEAIRTLLLLGCLCVGFVSFGATKDSISRLTISGPSSVTVGTGAVFSCSGSNYYGQTFTLSVRWSVSNSSYAYFSGNTLYATSAGAGKTITVIAEYGSGSPEKTGSSYRKTSKTVAISAYIPSNNATTTPSVTPSTPGVTPSTPGVTPSTPSSSGVTTPSGRVKKLRITGASNISVGNYETYVCTVTYSDKRTEKVSPRWSVSNSSVGYFSGNTLYIKSGGAKSIKITANFGNKKATKSIKINKQLSGISITGKDSVKGKKSIKLQCKAVYTDGSRKTIKPVWSLIADSSLFYYVSITSAGKLSYKTPLATANTVQVKAVSGNFQAVKNVLLEAGKVAGNSGGSSSGSMRISGPTSLKSTKSGTYSLYHNGAKVTSSSVKWGKSGNLLTVYDQGSTGRAVAGKTSGTSGYSYVTATYNGKTVRLRVTITR